MVKLGSGGMLSKEEDDDEPVVLLARGTSRTKALFSMELRATARRVGLETGILRDCGDTIPPQHQSQLLARKI